MSQVSMVLALLADREWHESKLIASPDGRDLTRDLRRLRSRGYKIASQKVGFNRFAYRLEGTPDDIKEPSPQRTTGSVPRPTLKLDYHPTIQEPDLGASEEELEEKCRKIRRLVFGTTNLLKTRPVP